MGITKAIKGGLAKSMTLPHAKDKEKQHHSDLYHLSVPKKDAEILQKASCTFSLFADPRKFACNGDPESCPLWLEIRAQAKQIAHIEPCLASYMYTNILNHHTICEALGYILAEKLGDGAMPSMQWHQLFSNVLETHEQESSAWRVKLAIRDDLLAIRTRDAACQNLCDAFLYYKGFLGLQAHRVSHWLWTHDRHSMARLLQARISSVFGMDIHPGAVIGHGVMFDHAQGVVVGETTVIGNDCSFLHNVTLGGTGKEAGDRHPKLGNNVSVGAGVSILGNIHVGDGAKIGAGSVVLREVPPGATMVGIPARQVVPKTPSDSEMSTDELSNVSAGNSVASGSQSMGSATTPLGQLSEMPGSPTPMQ